MRHRFLALALAFSANTAHAVVMPDHVYEFSGGGNDLNGGPTMELGAGSSFTGEGLTGGLRFASNLGPNVRGAFANRGLYSVELFFSLDQVGGYRRVLDFKNGTDEDGLYLYNGDISFFGQSKTADTNLKPGQMTHLVISRDGAQRVRAYVNGSEVFSFNDSQTADAIFSKTDGIARFFRDNGNEASAGFVDFIRLYDRVVDTTEVLTLYNQGNPIRVFDPLPNGVPEPSTWAAMLIGFAGVGLAVRRRRSATTLATG